jgi:hypothetical protein
MPNSAALLSFKCCGSWSCGVSKVTAPRKNRELHLWKCAQMFPVTHFHFLQVLFSLFFGPNAFLRAARALRQQPSCFCKSESSRALQLQNTTSKFYGGGSHVRGIHEWNMFVHLE